MTFDESKHPRAPAGVTEGGQWIAAVREGAGLNSREDNPGARNNTFKGFWEWTKAKARVDLTGKSEDWDKPTDEELEEIQLHYEQAWLVGPDGEHLGEIGETNGTSMNFTGAEEAEFPGNYLIHNHPGTGASLSGADIRYGFQESLKGMVVAEPNGLHILTYNNESLWNVAATGLEEDPIYIGYELADIWTDKMDNSLDMYRDALEAGHGAAAKDQLWADSKWAMEDIANESIYSKWLDFEFIPWSKLQ